ncbi:MAG: lytic transglycosylase domain-containing protein [Rickettsiales bacterium]|nr:lytic transglycosylase domain-containing protein [Rickettsiales bacterium]
MRFLVIVLTGFALSLYAAYPAYAALSHEQMEHAKSAFSFADDNNWNDALLHAKRANYPPLSKLITWQYSLSSNSKAGFDEITGFIDENRDWPEQKRLRIRAEQSLREYMVSDGEIIGWFTRYPPITGLGKLALARALSASGHPGKEQINSLIRDAWKMGDFEVKEEASILSQHNSLLQASDHIARTDRLLWDENIGAAKRMLELLDKPHQQLYEARIALIQDKKTAPLAVLQVDKNLKKDLGLQYDRMRYRARHNDDKGVRDILLQTPSEVPYPEKWWRLRDMAIRQAIDEKNYSMAQKLLANHAQIEGQGLADALWLHGWLHLDFLHNPKEAYAIFYRMYNLVKFPVSKARAAYWAARAAEQTNDKENAKNWYETASFWPITLYGQLAAYKHAGPAPLRLPPEPEVSGEAVSRFERSDLIQAIKLCVQMNEIEIANKMILSLVENETDDEHIILVAQLGTQIQKKFLSVRASKKALQRNIILAKTGYPTLKNKPSLAIPLELATAIVRQESEFDPNAKSSAGAVGMMQLLPSTAKEVAQKNDIAFSKERLYEPDYNMVLGSYYIGRLINAYDGSYIMAIAAYNAGPGNVRKWINQFGTPDGTVDGAINWIEKIPFSETRNYVLRVMENLQVYRHILSENGSSLRIEQDLTR